MKLLVTGGAGFIGSNFIHYWLEHYPNDELVNLDVLTYAGNLENLKAIETNKNYSFVKGDICDPEVVDDLVSRVDQVVHFAAESHVDRSIMGPGEFVRTNINGTFTLLEAAKRHQVKFHHVSTDEVYGSLELGTKTKFTVNTPYDPSSPYSASKAASDHLVKAYHRTYGLEVTLSNCSNNFGPYQFPEKFIPLTITNILEDKKVPIYGAGDQVRDWLYVNDHCRAIDLIVHKGKPGMTYLVGGMTDDITNLEVAQLIIKLMGADPRLIDHVTDRPGHDVRYSIDWKLSQKQLGYQPADDFIVYLKSTIDWYQNNKDWWQRIKSGEYQDYYQAQYKQ